MTTPVKVEFEGSLYSYKNPVLEGAIQLTFLRTDYEPTEGELEEAKMRRFKVTLEEIKDW